MLTHLHISDFTLVDHLDLELHQGLTTITGETGAGKSIMLGALGLALGDKTDADKVRAGSDKTEIHATFDIGELPAAQSWLTEQDLRIDDDCVLRRVITSEGRSRAYINGSSVPLQQLRVLGEMLADIHSQHEHQSLLTPSTHRRMLDESAGLTSLAEDVRSTFLSWNQTNEKLHAIQTQSDEINARFQLLRYQVDELDQLELLDNELDTLENKQKSLAHMETTQQSCGHVLDLCGADESGVLDSLNKALHIISKLPEKAELVCSAENLLQNAVIQVEEAKSELERFADNQDADPSKLPEIEQRLSQIYEISRKHKIHPNELVSHHKGLAEQLGELQSGDEQVEALELLADRQKQDYQTLADQLSVKRTKAGKSLQKLVNSQLQKLAMEHTQFFIQLSPTEAKPHKYGNENIEFLISTHPGQSPKPLAKVASGGELSRVSLAIQVVTAQTSATPTLVFDEVDVGIGGPTGDVVGSMLRELGSNAQVICVTHLAQVASKGHQHLRVSKSIDRSGASSSFNYLEKQEKVNEVARMMGGDVNSKQSIAHAKEMIKAA